MTVPLLSLEEARRIAIRAQSLDATRPSALLSTVEQLTFLQLDPTAVIAPSADLIAWSRLGAAYVPAQLERAVDRDRTLFEHQGQASEAEPVLALVRPMADLGLYLSGMRAWPKRGSRRHGWMTANEPFRRRVLDQLRDAGPLASRDIPDTSLVGWRSTGWRNDRNVTEMLESLAMSGDVAVSGRRGRERLWDLAERVFPADIPVVPEDDAQRIRAERRLRSLGVARPRLVGEAGVPVEIEGTAGIWRMDPGASAEGFVGRTALLSPFDRLIHDRVRSRELFDFEYVLEMYKPREQRRWGYFALPMLHGDRLVGKVDATADRVEGVLRVAAIHEDGPWGTDVSAAVDEELEGLARWLGLAAVVRV